MGRPIISDKAVGFTLLFAAAALLLFLFVSPSSCPQGKVEIVLSPEAEGEIVSLIRSAQQSIEIEMYVFTSEDIIRELGEAEERGVRVRVILEPRIDDSRQNRTFALLEALGCEVKWGSFSYKLTHSKFMIIDGKAALVGSINFSESALHSNREAAVLLEGESVLELASVFEEDWGKAG
jgi:phosphatidylserine/phosphatidylglycerophosphate/cardiolipin synthase-like enzyme